MRRRPSVDADADSGARVRGWARQASQSAESTGAKNGTKSRGDAIRRSATAGHRGRSTRYGGLVPCALSDSDGEAIGGGPGELRAVVRQGADHVAGSLMRAAGDPACGPVADRKPRDPAGRLRQPRRRAGRLAGPGRAGRGRRHDGRRSPPPYATGGRRSTTARYLPSSGILFSGRVDGAPLALVAADVPGESASWLLQLTGERRSGTR